MTKKSLKHKILDHLNADIFEFRKKNRVYRVQRCQNSKTMSFNMLTYFPPPPSANRNKTQWLTPGLIQKNGIDSVMIE